MHHYYTVLQRPDGRWQGGQRNARVPYLVTDTRTEAEELMCEMAMAMGSAHVVVLGAKGEVLRDRAFSPTKADTEDREQEDGTRPNGAPLVAAIGR